MQKLQLTGFDLLWRACVRTTYFLDRRHLSEKYQRLVKKKKIFWQKGKDMNLGWFKISRFVDSLNFPNEDIGVGELLGPIYFSSISENGNPEPM